MARKSIPFGLKGAGGLSLPILTKDGEKLDVEENRRYVEFLVEKGCHTIVPGSLCLSLSDEERHQLWEIYADVAKNKMAIMPYLGYREMTIKQLVQEIKAAEEAGVNSLYFSVKAVYEIAREVKFSQSLWPGTVWPKEYEEAVYEYLKAGFEATELPVCIYNNIMPNVAGTIPPEFLVRLAEDFDNFSGLKTNSSATGFEPYNLLPYEVEMLKPFGIPVAKGFVETEFVQALMYGCTGFVAPVVGHVFPDKLNEMCEAYYSGDIRKAFEIQKSFIPIVKVWRRNEFGVKGYLMEALGFEGGHRKPAFPLTPQERKQIDDLLKKWGVYKKYKYSKW